MKKLRQLRNYSWFDPRALQINPQTRDFTWLYRGTSAKAEYLGYQQQQPMGRPWHALLSPSIFDHLKQTAETVYMPTTTSATTARNFAVDITCTVSYIIRMNFPKLFVPVTKAKAFSIQTDIKGAYYKIDGSMQPIDADGNPIGYSSFESEQSVILYATDPDTHEITFVGPTFEDIESIAFVKGVAGIGFINAQKIEQNTAQRFYQWSIPVLSADQEECEQLIRHADDAPENQTYIHIDDAVRAVKLLETVYPRQKLSAFSGSFFYPTVPKTLPSTLIPEWIVDQHKGNIQHS